MKVPQIAEQCHVQVMQGEWSPERVMEQLIAAGQEDPFYIMDLGQVVARHNRWINLMPRVQPFYAVKCNDDRMLVSTLAALGTGFDCASKAEMELVTSLGVTPDFARLRSISSDARSRSVTPTGNRAENPARHSVARRALMLGLVADAEPREIEVPSPPRPKAWALGVQQTPGGSMNVTSQKVPITTTPGGHVKRDDVPLCRIIFANPAKMNSHIRRACALGVDVMTFDSEVELQKIKQIMPHAQLVIRIRCDAAAAQCPLGMKFGCDPLVEAPRLLKLAALHRLNVVGVSFHVGSGAGESAVYDRAIRASRVLFDIAARLGHPVRLLDLGGGFPGGSDTDILEVSQVINNALDTHFPESNVRVIAEPGRYFAAAAYKLATMIHSIREIPSAEEDGEKHTMYFINDGVYGSFNCILYDHQHVTCYPLKEAGSKTIKCSIWGPSCDGLDCVLPAARLAAQALGSWLVFPDMGAYTLPVASPFNGFPVPTVKHVVDARIWSAIKDSLPVTSEGSLTTTLEGLPSPSPPLSPSPPPSPPSPQEHAAVFIECALK